jgi:hypothetical protein
MKAYMKNLARTVLEEVQLPIAARKERRRDAAGLPETDPGIERFVREGVAWLGRAQDNSTSRDGGVSRDYSLVNGWASSYPETTGYILTTLIDYGRRTGSSEALARARRMLDWLEAIQLEDGGFQGGLVDATPVVPVTFNTGQILLGLAAGVLEFDAYQEAARRAADFLATTQDADGCWRRYPTPFARRGDKAYETHVSWGLIEADRVFPGRGYADSALRQITWALGKQASNGWIAECCLTDPAAPLTHTLGYFLRGVIEAYRYTRDDQLLSAARLTADGLLSAIGDDGFLPGRLRSDWSAAADWSCLTGSVQIAHCWLLLYGLVGDERYRDCAFAANRYVRRTMHVSGNPSTRGAVKGSFPVDGDYGKYQFLNWAAKFAIDANLLEQDTRNKCA